MQKSYFGHARWAPLLRCKWNYNPFENALSLGNRGYMFHFETSGVFFYPTEITGDLGGPTDCRILFFKFEAKEVDTEPENDGFQIKSPFPGAEISGEASMLNF